MVLTYANTEEYLQDERKPIKDAIFLHNHLLIIKELSDDKDIDKAIRDAYNLAEKLYNIPRYLIIDGKKTISDDWYSLRDYIWLKAGVVWDKENNCWRLHPATKLMLKFDIVSDAYRFIKKDDELRVIEEMRNYYNNRLQLLNMKVN